MKTMMRPKSMKHSFKDNRVPKGSFGENKMNRKRQQNMNNTGRPQNNIPAAYTEPQFRQISIGKSRVSLSLGIAIFIFFTVMLAPNVTFANITAEFGNYLRNDGDLDYPVFPIPPAVNYTKTIQFTGTPFGFNSDPDVMIHDVASLSESATLSADGTVLSFTTNASFSVDLLHPTNWPYNINPAVQTIPALRVLNAGGAVRYAINISESATAPAPYLTRLESGNSIVSFVPGMNTGIISRSNFYYTRFLLGAGETSPQIGVNNGSPHASYTIATQGTLQELPNLDYFGIGVDWSAVNDPNMNTVHGDKDVQNMQNALKKFPTISTNQRPEYLDATTNGAGNAYLISNGFNEFAKSVGAKDTVLFYASSHGDANANNDPASAEFEISADGSMLTSGSFADMLNDPRLSTTRKIVVLDACEGKVMAQYLADHVHNIAILTGTGDTMSVWPSDGSPLAGTGLYTDALVNELNSGKYDLQQIISDMVLHSGTAYGNLIGQPLFLKNSGTGIFTGLGVGLYESSDFNGDLLGPTINPVPEPSSLLLIGVGMAIFALTNRSRTSAVWKRTLGLKLRFIPTSAAKISIEHPSLPSCTS